MISNIRASEHFVIFESEGKRYNVPIENVPDLWLFYHERVKPKQSEDQHAVPSKQLAEQAIAGMADIVRELNELRAFKAGVPWEAIRNMLIDYYDSDDENLVAISIWRFDSAPTEAIDDTKR